jgi:uncharacterized protein (DUF983 family)
MSITAAYIMAGGLLIVGIILAIWEIYKMGRPPECPHCGNREGHKETIDKKLVCQFCGNEVDYNYEWQDK